MSEEEIDAYNRGVEAAAKALEGDSAWLASGNRLAEYIRKLKLEAAQKPPTEFS